MSQFRRQGDRRRRVLMTSASATATANPTPGSRSRMESLREARRPTLVYGTRVREGLRGRWFSLVPVDRSALAKLLAAVSTIVLAIVLMNDATVRFQSIESQPAFVNVFQIIRPGSLGRYVIGLMYLIVAGTAWMVYQLRRFRNDDFRGKYRLWQWIVAASLLSSIATLVPLAAMLGAGIEMIMGRRIALSGHDWIGLFLVVGGAILALRTIAEMWRYRTSLMMVMGGWFCVALPVAAQWNVVAVNTNIRWSIVTAAPLLAVTLWFAATVSYLRSLYREVRGIEHSSGFLQRLRDATPRPFSRGDSSEPVGTSTKDEPSTTRQPVAVKPNNPARVRPAVAASESVGAEKTAVKRRWFGLLPPAKPRVAKRTTNGSETTESRSEKRPPRKAKHMLAVANDDRDGSASDNDNASDESDNAVASPPKRRWWPSLRGRSKATSDVSVTANEDEEESPADEADSQKSESKKRRFGLRSMMKRNRGSQADETEADEQRGKATSPNRSESHSSAKERPAANLDEDDDDESDEENDSDDDIDWSSMNKAERRRMRKQLKRGGKAA